MPLVEAQFLRDPDQVAALFLLLGVAAGETKPGPAWAEAGGAAAAGDVSPVKPFTELQAMNEDVVFGGHLLLNWMVCASSGVPQQTGRQGRLPQLV